MFRQSVSKVISAAMNSAKNGISRPVSKRSSNKTDWVATEASKSVQNEKESPCDNPKEKLPSAGLKKQESPCDNFKQQPCPESNIKSVPCDDFKPQPCPENKPSPCDDINKKSATPCDELKKQARQKLTPCDEAKKGLKTEKIVSSSDSNQQSADLCGHHKNLVPPSSVLAQLKTFELKSECSSFHLKSSGRADTE